MAAEQLIPTPSVDKPIDSRQALRAALLAARENVSWLLELTDAVLDVYGNTAENVEMTARLAASWLCQSGLDVMRTVRQEVRHVHD